MTKLEFTDISNRLAEYPRWEYANDALRAEIEFKSFKECFSVMTQIAFECEALNHHPEWSNVYNKLIISLTTHDAGGVTELDFKLLNRIDKIL